MALVTDIVTRFKAETSDYLAKQDALRAKNRETALAIVQSAGSAEEALASLTIARQKNALGDFGIDRRNVSGITSEIRAIARESRGATEEVLDMEQALRKVGDRAGGLDDIVMSFSDFSKGDILAGFEKWKKGWADLEETKGLGGTGVKVALIGAALNVVGEMTAKATGEAVKLKQEYEAGKISGGQLTESLLAQIPILGNVWQTGRNIRELIGLENRDYERQNTLLGQILDARQKILDVDKGRRERATKDADGTQAIQDATEVARLNAQGKTAEATQVALKYKLKADVKAFADEANKNAKDQIQALADAMNKPAKEGEKSLNQQLREAADAKRAAQQLVEDSKTDWEIDSTKAQEKLNLATENYTRLQSLAAENLKQRQQLEADAKKAIEDRTKALNEQHGVESKKAKDEADKKSKDEADKAKAEIGKNLKDVLTGFVTKAENNPAVQWIKGQIDSANKAWEKMKTDAAKFREDNKSEVEKFKDKLDEAQRLKNNGLLSNDDLKKSNTKSMKALLEEEADLQEQGGKSVYELPQISELRGGQTLFNSPEVKLSEKQVERLGEIREELRLLREQNETNGIEISVVK